MIEVVVPVARRTPVSRRLHLAMPIRANTMPTESEIMLGSIKTPTRPRTATERCSSPRIRAIMESMSRPESSMTFCNSSSFVFLSASFSISRSIWQVVRFHIPAPSGRASFASEIMWAISTMVLNPFTVRWSKPLIPYPIVPDLNKSLGLWPSMRLAWFLLILEYRNLFQMVGRDSP